MSSGSGFIYDGTFPLNFLREGECVGNDGDAPGRISVRRRISVPGQEAEATQSVGFSLGDLVVRDWDGTLLCIRPYRELLATVRFTPREIDYLLAAVQRHWEIVKSDPAGSVMLESARAKLAATR